MKNKYTTILILVMITFGFAYYAYAVTSKSISYNSDGEGHHHFSKIRTPIISAPSDLKIMPNVKGDVILFSDTDVNNAVDGQELKIWRKAVEGDDYMRFYLTASQKGMIHTSADLTMQGQQNFTINSVTNDIYFKVGDNAGAKKFYFKDSDGTNLMTLDSNAYLTLNGNTLIEGIDGFDSASETATVYIGDTQNYIQSIYQGNSKFKSYNGIEIIDRFGTIATFTNGLVDVNGNIAVSGTVDGVDVATLNSSVSNIDNTSDTDKPISTATQTALDTKLTATGILRKIQIMVRDGATPGTNMDITKTTTQGRAYNAPTITDADDLAKSGSSGSYSLSANGQNLTLDFAETVTNVLISVIISDDLSGGTGGGYYVHALVINGNIQFAIEKSGEDDNEDWTSVTGAGSNAVIFDVLFMTSD